MKDQKSRVEPRRVITCGYELLKSTTTKKTLPQTELKSASLYDYMECKKYQVEF